MYTKRKKLLFYTVYFFVTIPLLAEIILRVTFHLVDNKIGFYQTFNMAPDYLLWEEVYKSIPENSYIKYDSLLGWSIRPNAVFRDSLYVSNSQGIRSDYEYSINKDTSVIRIAVLGDSFTHGDDVYNNETWAYYLNKGNMNQTVKYEVINFGVSGYGMGQAYNRFKLEAETYKPDIVILGFQLENFWRNLNVFRPNYYLYTGIPFSKPRAILRNDSIDFVNIPTIPVDSLIHYITGNNFQSIKDYEYFHHNKIILDSDKTSWLFIIKLVKGLYDFSQFGYHHESYEESEIGIQIVDELLLSFKHETERIGAKFCIVQLPVKEEVEYYKQHHKTSYNSLTEHFFEKYTVLKLDSILSNYSLDEIYKGHYSPKGNKIIAHEIYNWLITTDDLNTIITDSRYSISN